MTRKSRHAASLAAVWIGACTTDSRDDPYGSDAGIVSSGSETGLTTFDDDKLDVGQGTTGATADDGGSDEGCQSVDFLFVIDSSISMGSNQSELVASFPDFVKTIANTLGSVDSYHVGVVTSDAYASNEPGCTQLGALVTQTGGPDASGTSCGPFAEGRYMTQADDLPAAFSCAAAVGSGGDNDERMMGAALAAISPELNAAGACNAGFIRDDALLVMVLITDEDDPGSCGIPGITCNGSSGDPPSWHSEVLARKVHPQNVVVLSLTRGAPGNTCGSPGLAEIDGTRIMAFSKLFQDNGFVGDICAPFGPFFEEAVGVIASACDGFIPPG